MLAPYYNLGLSDAEIDEFFDVGWITRPSLFAADEVARMRYCFAKLEHVASTLRGTGLHNDSQFVLEKSHGAKIIKRVVWAGGCQPYLLRVGNDPRLTAPCAQLLQSPTMDHLLNQAHFKRPGDGVVFDWHQDIQHRDKGDGTWTDVNGHGSYVQTLIVLDEMTPDSGPLMFVPGSSQWGRMNLNGRSYDNSSLAVDTQPEWVANAVTIEASPGDVLFFGPYTVHGSFENNSTHYRRVLINGYAAPGANQRVYPGSGVGQRLEAPVA
jgi:hypothetical protein